MIESALNGVPRRKRKERRGGGEVRLLLEGNYQAAKVTERGAEGGEWTCGQIGVTAVLLEKDIGLNIPNTYIHGNKMDGWKAFPGCCVLNKTSEQSPGL